MPDVPYPICRNGKNACPPEDCGGIGGFIEYKKAISNSKHPRHEEFMEWNGPYDPLEFNVRMTNFRLISKKIPKNATIKIVAKTRHQEKAQRHVELRVLSHEKISYGSE